MLELAKNRIEAIPAIDIIGGQCVRLTKGDYAQKTVYADSPVELARQFEALGFRHLHLVDLDGARAGHVVNTATLREITRQTSLIVDFGGGIRTDDDLRQAFDNGARIVTVGSVAVKQPDLVATWIDTYSPDRICLAADTRQGRVSTNGWMEDHEQNLLDFIGNYRQLGVRNVLCTDISRDGTLTGPAISLYQGIMAAYPDLRLIASGGVSAIGDVVSLRDAGIPAVVIGKAIYEGRIDLHELAKLNTEDA